MKNILAENLLRFGAKGINENMLTQYLLEQSYKNDPMFAVMYEKLGDRSKRYWDGKDKGAAGQIMTDEDRDKLLNTFTQKIVEKQQKTGNNQSKVLKSVETVVIGSKKGEATSVIQAMPSQPITHVFTAVYPNNQQANPELQNFFLSDNVVEVSPENEAKFKTLILDLVSSIPKNETITKIQVYAGSSTSKVPTTYGMAPGTKYKTIEEGQQNNIALANARYDVIVNKLSELVKQLVPQFTGEILVAPKSPEDVKPNNGPEYTQTEREYYFKGTTDGKVLPDKRAQYDKTYGPYKGSFGGVTIYTEDRVGGTTPPEPETQVTQDWSISLRLKSQPKENPKLPKIFKGNKGGGIIYNGKAKIGCACW